MFNKNDGTKAFKPVGRLRVFFALPFYIAVLLIVLNIVLYFIDFPAATVMSVFMVFYIAIYLYMQLALKPGIMHDIIAFSSNYSQVQRQLLYELSVPYCLLDTNGRVMWLNKAMCACINKKKDFKKNISTLFPEITANIFPQGLECVSVKAKDESVESVLKRVLANTGLTYRFEGDIIVIREQLMNMNQQEEKKEITITGRVTDEKKEPIPGATILLKGTSLGTATNVDGSYKLTIPEMKDCILVFSFVGMQTQEVKYVGKDTVHVVMVAQLETLDDVVVTGIFKKSKESYTGAVRVVTDKELKEFKGRNLITTLANIDPAFNMIANNDLGSNPNSLPQVQIRGAASLPNIGELQDNSHFILYICQ